MTEQQPTILVVEDDMEMNELQCELLALHGFASVPAYSGTEAIEHHCNGTIDAILLDVMLPEIDGFETCRRIRENTARQVPIIMLTALDTEDCRKRGFDAGADSYFVKPFNPAEVVNTLEMLLGRE
ncbi:MAG: response regulator transcription factor [Phycisphaerales bacterium]|jgi:DNA-binding response OmpR family regulator|nr:response regulator transcription factor [Phycisphaerales bacterium]MBT7171424.1 response regulator transcription factor [Phycisphaerales bacterium]